MEVQNIRIDLISPSPLNPRKTFDEAALQELASNIEKQGLLQPITVRVAKSEDVTDLETGDVTTIPCSYEIVCGERRFRAVSLLKEKEDKENVAKIKAHRKKSEQFQTISCIVREMTDDEAFEAMITENLQRKDVDPIEEAFAFAQLTEKGRTLEDIALKFGKSTRFVFDRIKLNGLIPELKDRVRNGDIPLSGAMILSKLEDSSQMEFHKGNPNQCSTDMIRRFVGSSFLEIDKADWIEENADNWDNGEFKPCAQCENNTVNHGCLFYEMNNKNARCINPDCFRKKQIAYLIRKIQLESEFLVKAGEPLSFGKTVIMETKLDTYCSDSRKAFLEQTLEAVRSLGFEMINPDEVFKGKCWYAENDERTQKMLEDGEIYRCISLWNYYCPEFDVEYYYIRKELSSSTSALADPKDIEREKINEKLKKAKDKVIEKSSETMRKWAQEKPYYKRNKELSVDEQTVFDVMILRNCSSKYLETLKLSTYKKESDFVKYVKNNQADRNQWYRAFIANNLSSNDVMFYPYMQKCQNILFAEQYPDDYTELGKQLATSFDKKQKKLNERLKELENDNTEEALRFPLFIDMLMKTWTDEQLAILDSEYSTADLKELAKRLCKTLTAVKAKALNRKLRRSPKTGFWNSERVEKLKELYPNHTNEEIAQILGTTYSAVNGIAFKLRLFKSKEFKFQCASKSFFPKGHQPMNKGRKQTEYMSDAQIEKTKATRFKKGCIPKNHKEVGYERITRDGYIEVKTAEPNVFELKHRLVWIEHNGEIPSGYNIQFKDGDKQNICIENLYMISRSEQMKTQNSMYARYPEDVQYLIKLKGVLNRQINKATKKNES